MTSAVSKRLKVEIDDYCATAYDDGHRTHLGASLIGDDCKRKLWYIFRWVKKEKFDGRQQRLFNRGHREEERFVEWLRGIGCEVWTHDKDGKQFRINGVMGHFGGSLDAIIKFPAKYNIPKPVLGEFKTSGTGKAFNSTVKDGMPIAKPVHFAQTSLYGWKYGFEHVVYNMINKNDDDLHVEVTKLNFNLAQQLETKAEFIIRSEVAPPRISNDPTAFACAYCSKKDVCHYDAIPEKNCRSCENAVPIENAEWFCKIHSPHNGPIPKSTIPTGCDLWNPVK